jgi:hypothetical protein
MILRRAYALAVVVSLAGASPAAAHGIGGRGDLPIPKSYYVWGASLAVAASFLAAAVLWSTPWAARLGSGHAAPGWTDIVQRVFAPVTRALGLVTLTTVLIAGWGGPADPTSNIAPVALYVVLWVAMLWASALIGPFWQAFNPWDTLAGLLGGPIGPTPPAEPAGRSVAYSHWPAAAGLFAFVWLELAYFDPSSPRVVAVGLTVYTVLVLAAVVRRGRRWVQTGEAFTVLFGLVALISPIGRRDDGRVTWRLPFAGLAALAPRRGTVAVVLTVLGGTTFDGVTRTPWWGERIRLTTGWERTGVNTLGLVTVIGLVTVAYLAATWCAAALARSSRRDSPQQYVHTLIPIALAYSVAHYFSLAVFEGQTAWRLMSDPFGRGWDVFGTANHQIDYLALSTGLIALVVTAAMIVGHVVGVVLAHDRAAEQVGGSRAVISQLPVAAVMIGLTVTGLTLLLSV